MKEYGQVDILINNVGGTDPKRDLGIEKLDINYFDEVFHLNLCCTMYLSQQVIPIMVAHGGGNIVNVASISGMTADANGTLYGASKAGVINLTKYIATQLGKKNIRCNAVAPGLILTPAALDNLNEDVRNIFWDNAPRLIWVNRKMWQLPLPFSPRMTPGISPDKQSS